MATLPVVDFAPFLADKASPEGREACKAITAAFCEYGCLAVRNPQVPLEENDKFLDLMERYWALPDAEKRKDTRPDLHYQVGATPENTEVPRDHRELIDQFPEEHRPHMPSGADPKWRFFWRLGQRPPKTDFEQLNADPVVPEAFKGEWEQTMNSWGSHLLSTARIAAEMVAIGFELQSDFFTSKMTYGPHLLAPTGADLKKYGDKGTVFAGFHTDLNFITAHGKSRFPGLSVWTRNGERQAAKIPDGCLLLQAGKQFEWITGGKVLAGFHEVVVNDGTIKAIDAAKAKGKESIWRVSSTVFSHLGSDESLEPIEKFSSKEVLAKYPPIKVGEQVKRELEAIALA